MATPMRKTGRSNRARRRAARRHDDREIVGGDDERAELVDAVGKGVSMRRSSVPQNMPASARSTMPRPMVAMTMENCG